MVGVMGPGNASAEVAHSAEQLGTGIAEQGWTLLTGGRRVGVMDAASRGASTAGGLVVGVLPSSDRSGMSPHVNIPICTGIGSARNNINVLSSDLVIACGVGMGTLSEILLAAKAGKHVILLHQTESSEAVLQEFDSNTLHFVSSVEEAITLAKKLVELA
ncbi:MAG: TIGR00725 family protein [Balneolaceae bacterium]|nr:TIGR00725 family protein [Balneolaceae bacterium]